MTMYKLWKRYGMVEGLKVRYQNWNYQIHYFCIEGISENGSHLVGRLDNGEWIEYPKDSMHWEVFEAEHVNMARAV